MGLHCRRYKRNNRTVLYCIRDESALGIPTNPKRIGRTTLLLWKWEKACEWLPTWKWEVMKRLHFCNSGSNTGYISGDISGWDHSTSARSSEWALIFIPVFMLHSRSIYIAGGTLNSQFLFDSKHRPWLLPNGILAGLTVWNSLPWAIQLLIPNNLGATWRRICSPDIRNVSALEVLCNCTLNIDIYLVTYWYIWRQPEIEETQGRIIHCAGCTMGGAPAVRGPRSTAKFLPRCVGLNVMTTKKRLSTFWEKKSAPGERKSWVGVWEKGPRLTLVWGPRMVNPALRRPLSNWPAVHF